jgi:hypothetical protein
MDFISEVVTNDEEVIHTRTNNSQTFRNPLRLALEPNNLRQAIESNHQKRRE